MTISLCPACGAYWDCEHQYTVLESRGLDFMPPDGPTLSQRTDFVADFGFKPDLTVGQVIDDLLRDIGWANELKAPNPMCRSWLSPEMLADSAAQP